MIRARDLIRRYEKLGYHTDVIAHPGDRGSTLRVFDSSPNGRRLVVAHFIDGDGLCHPLAVDRELQNVDSGLALDIHTHVEKIRWVPGYVQP